MDELIQVIVLVDGTIIISKIGQVVSELGEPDCRLIRPLTVEGLKPWLGNLTDQTDDIMISSDKILTLVDPKEDLLNDYLTLTK
tara:strand:+ start:1037 stop:1288 length:252 start_codon:yes stop_codon:yes gene_type:complete